MNNHNNSNELYHFGVKGMRWGVINSKRVLTNHRRNAAVKKIKNDYDIGKISKEQKRSMIKSENEKKKSSLKKYKEKVGKITDEQTMKSEKISLNKQLLSEVPNYRVKTGMHTVNTILHGAGIAINGAQYANAASLAATVGLMSPPFAAVLAGSLVGTTAMMVGRKYIVDKAVDKVS